MEVRLYIAKDTRDHELWAPDRNGKPRLVARVINYDVAPEHADRALDEEYARKLYEALAQKPMQP